MSAQAARLAQVIGGGAADARQGELGGVERHGKQLGQEGLKTEGDKNGPIATFEMQRECT